MVIIVNILICDDDEISIQESYNILTEYAIKNRLNFNIETRTNSLEVLNSKDCYDIALLDIEMPYVTGLTLISHLNEINKNIQIFIITSYSCYLDNAIDLNVFRYINKPIDKERFFRGLDIAVEKYNSNRQIITLDNGIFTRMVTVSDIIFITIEKRKVVFVTKNGSLYSNQKLSYWAEQLAEFDNLVSTHHSYIVNLDYVIDFDRTEVLLRCGSNNYTAPLSQRNYTSFKKTYFASL